VLCVVCCVLMVTKVKWMSAPVCLKQGSDFTAGWLHPHAIPTNPLKNKSPTPTPNPTKSNLQGVISYLAVVLITYLAFSMLRFSNVEEKYSKKLQAAAKNVRACWWWGDCTGVVH